MYLNEEQIQLFIKLLRTFFMLPYSTDLDGKDAETLLRIVKRAEGRPSRRKELFDIIDGDVGYSVKTLAKSYTARRVDIQEQRLGEVEEIRKLMVTRERNEEAQGRILLAYMYNRIQEQMTVRGIKVAKSLILLKNWNANKTVFRFRYWEEDFVGYVNDLYERNERGEIEWVRQEAGLHGRDRLRKDNKGNQVRLLRMHYKHNQIFTDHDIPVNAVRMDFEVQKLSWERLSELLETNTLPLDNDQKNFLEQLDMD